MVQVEKCDVKNKKELEMRERHWLETLGAGLNKYIPTRTYDEWREENKEQISEHKKKYYEENRDKILEYQKGYREVNKDKLSERDKKYYEENRDKILEDQSKKITCDCGSEISKQCLSRHLKTIKHKAWQDLFNFINS
jgi:hypothetical protein